MVADKEWYCGQLIQDLHAQYGVESPDPGQVVAHTPGGVCCCPLEHYDQTVWGNVATLYTTMTDFDGRCGCCSEAAKWPVLSRSLPPACAMTADTAMPTYTKRWRIENFFAENAFLGVNHLPSLNLNAIQTMLSLRLLAFHVVDKFRHDLGLAYQKKDAGTDPSRVRRRCPGAGAVARQHHRGQHLRIRA